MQVLSVSEIGPLEKKVKYSTITRLWFIYKQKLRPANYYMCPQCGYSANIENVNQPSIASSKTRPSILRKIIKRLIYPFFFPIEYKHRWLMAIYKK